MPGLPQIAHDVVKANLTYLGEDKLLGLFDAMSRVKAASVPGDFAEFGMALGGTAICIASQLDAGRRFFGFDLFGMIPPPTAIDGDRANERYRVIRDGRSHGRGGGTYYGYIENLFDTVKGNFAQFGQPVDGQRIILVKGLFEDTLPLAGDAPIAFAHIDSDWYDPVMLCLNHVSQRMPVGGIIVLDDYLFWDGCTKAADAFCAAHREIVMLRKTPHAILAKVA